MKKRLTLIALTAIAACSMQASAEGGIGIGFQGTAQLVSVVRAQAPEPATISLLAVGFVALGIARRRARG